MDEGGSLYIMPDGRIVALSESAIDMISEMGDQQEGEEEDMVNALEEEKEEVRSYPAVPVKSDNEVVAEIRLDDNLLATSSVDFDSYVDTITLFRCKNCDYSSQSREQMMDHVKGTHLYIKAIQEAKVLVSDELDPGGEDEEDANPEQSVNGLSIIVNDRFDADVGEEELNSDGGDRSSESFQGSTFRIIVQGEEKEMFDSGIEEEERLTVSGGQRSADEDLVETKKNPIFDDGKKMQVFQFEADHEKRRLNCSFKTCNFVFKHSKQLEYHLSCHQDDSTSFACVESGCEVKSDKWRDMATHLWRQHNVDCDMLLCGVCMNYRTMYPKILESHNQTHLNLKQFRCDVCEKGFNQMSQLKNHAVIHLNKSSEFRHIPSWAKPKQCDICQKMFSDSKSLKKHVQAIHSKLKPYICQVCGHQSARKAMLQLHVRQHTGEKPFVCDSCDYRTGDHNSLRRHKRKHTGDKPYRCPYCQYAAIQSSSFKSHLR